MPLIDSLSRYSRFLESPDDFHRSNRSHVENLMHADEEFVCAISVLNGRWARWMLRHSTKLVLTTERVIMFKQSLLRSKSEDYALDAITSVQYSTGLLAGKIRLQGSAIDDRYKTTTSAGQQFVTELRRLNS